METPQHNMSSLFAQLGLPADSTAIDRFISTHSPLPSSTLLADAPFWNAAQSGFLREEKQIDADWIVVIETLNSLLRCTRC